MQGTHCIPRFSPRSFVFSSSCPFLPSYGNTITISQISTIRPLNQPTLLLHSHKDSCNFLDTCTKVYLILLHHHNIHSSRTFYRTFLHFQQTAPASGENTCGWMGQVYDSDPKTDVCIHFGTYLYTVHSLFSLFPYFLSHFKFSQPKYMVRFRQQK